MLLPSYRRNNHIFLQSCGWVLLISKINSIKKCFNVGVGSNHQIFYVNRLKRVFITLHSQSFYEQKQDPVLAVGWPVLFFWQNCFYWVLQQTVLFWQFVLELQPGRARPPHFLLIKTRINPTFILLWILRLICFIQSQQGNRKSLKYYFLLMEPRLCSEVLCILCNAMMWWCSG